MSKIFFVSLFILFVCYPVFTVGFEEDEAYPDNFQEIENMGTVGQQEDIPVRSSNNNNNDEISKSNDEEETPIDVSHAEAPEFVELSGPDPVEPPAEEIALEAAYGALIIPEETESNCARLAGRTLQCVAENRGQMDKCSAIVERHYFCVMKEAINEGGHVNHHRVKKCRHGYFVFNPFDIYFAIAMELYGEWSELEWENMLLFISPGDHVLDIGAHMGSLTIPIATRVGMHGSVIAFEPQRIMHTMTTANVALNGLWNTKVMNVGVGRSTGSSMRFETPPPHLLRNFGGMPLTENATSWAGGGVEEVAIISIDSLNLTRVDFMKVDVEGMEEAVIDGAMDTIARYKPVLYFEDNGYGGIIPRDQVYESSLVRRLEKLDYVCYFDLQPYFNPNNYGKESENFFQFSNGSPQVSTMILCVHPFRVAVLPDEKFRRIISTRPQ